MGVTVNFKFTEGQRVQTLNGDRGTINFLAMSNGIVKYYVNFELKGQKRSMFDRMVGQWWKEIELKALPTMPKINPLHKPAKKPTVIAARMAKAKPKKKK